MQRFILEKRQRYRNFMQRVKQEKRKRYRNFMRKQRRSARDIETSCRELNRRSARDIETSCGDLQRRSARDIETSCGDLDRRSARDIETSCGDLQRRSARDIETSCRELNRRSARDIETSCRDLDRRSARDVEPSCRDLVVRKSRDSTIQSMSREPESECEDLAQEKKVDTKTQAKDSSNKKKIDHGWEGKKKKFVWKSHAQKISDDTGSCGCFGAGRQSRAEIVPFKRTSQIEGMAASHDDAVPHRIGAEGSSGGSVPKTSFGQTDSGKYGFKHESAFSGSYGDRDSGTSQEKPMTNNALLNYENRKEGLQKTASVTYTSAKMLKKRSNKENSAGEMKSLASAKDSTETPRESSHAHKATEISRKSLPKKNTAETSRKAPRLSDPSEMSRKTNLSNNEAGVLGNTDRVHNAAENPGQAYTVMSSLEPVGKTCLKTGDSRTLHTPSAVGRTGTGRSRRASLDNEPARIRQENIVKPVASSRLKPQVSAITGYGSSPYLSSRTRSDVFNEEQALEYRDLSDEDIFSHYPQPGVEDDDPPEVHKGPSFEDDLSGDYVPEAADECLYPVRSDRVFPTASYEVQQPYRNSPERKKLGKSKRGRKKDARSNGNIMKGKALVSGAGKPGVQELKDQDQVVKGEKKKKSSLENIRQPESRQINSTKEQNSSPLQIDTKNYGVPDNDANSRKHNGIDSKTLQVLYGDHLKKSTGADSSPMPVEDFTAATNDRSASDRQKKKGWYEKSDESETQEMKESVGEGEKRKQRDADGKMEDKSQTRNMDVGDSSCGSSWDQQKQFDRAHAQCHQPGRKLPQPKSNQRDGSVLKGCHSTQKGKVENSYLPGEGKDFINNDWDNCRDGDDDDDSGARNCYSARSKRMDTGVGIYQVQGK